MTYNIDRAIGSIEATLKLLLEGQGRAEIGRKQLYEQIAALRAEIADYKHRLERLEQRMNNIEKPVAALGRWQQRGLGALTAISLIAALIGGTLAASWQKIIDVFK